MIRSKIINDKEVLCYSIGQVAARIGRRPTRLRIMEGNGIIPEPYLRTDQDYRLYTIHEVNVLVVAFRTFPVGQGRKFPLEFKSFLATRFDAIALHYKNPKYSLPPEADCA